MTKHIYCDVAIAGCGVAGLYTALNLPEDLHVLMICKEDMDTCDSTCSLLPRGTVDKIKSYCF